ncbi:MAG TPA: hypothetical protein VKB50_29140 [Vicinamibacterales bacterium]|nr:hypothetical protein [Vicinamibacterales bacterium]
MKILFLMDSPEYLRFYDSAIEELAARGHAVSIAVNSSRSRKPIGLEGLQAYADLVRVLGVVPYEQGIWAGVARGVRATMDFVRFLHPRFADAHALRARMKRKVLPRAYSWIDAIPRLSATAVRVVQRGLAAMEQAIPVPAGVLDFLRAHSPDVLMVSPLVAAASEQVDWIKGAHRCGIRSAVCIASWDNLTNKGLLRIEPDRVVVWNEAQKREAAEYHYIPESKIVVTGAQLFDRWFDRTVTRTREEFCRRAGLPDARPFLLFTGSSSFISESRAEVAFVRQWIRAVRASAEPALREVAVLVRPHPYNASAWESDPLADLFGVAVYPRRGYNAADPENRTDFFDSLAHAAAVVGINTSAMIEAAIVGTPVCSLLAPEFAGTQSGTIHFHHLELENGGCVRMASTLPEHLAQLGDALTRSDAARQASARFVASFVRPHGIDRAATPILAGGIEALGSSPSPPPRPAPLWSYLLRPIVLAAAAPVPIVDWLRKPPLVSRLRKRARDWAKVAGKRWQKSMARW